MGWNGGVSLAVWMGGVAVELDEARRARRPVTVDDAESLPPPLVTDTARSAGALYHALLAAFDRRLVIDILAGASAGGLNGALLAGAIVHDRPLTADFLRERWISIGDFSTLLQPLSNKDPGSVMQGSRFLEQVTLAFEKLLDGRDPPRNAGCDGREPVLLDIQVTDVLGKQHCFTDTWEQPFYASEYRAPVRFRRFDDYRADTLAAAARASASFPAAFEPQKLTGRAAALMGLPGKTRWAVDGGLLENAPIKPAIELIPKVPTTLPSQRYVCYVNAAPTAYEPDDDAPPDQPGLLKVLGYTVNLPREGRVIDQLYALDDAARRAGANADTGVRLLALDRDVLRQTALGLLPAYQERRAILSLTELLGERLEGRDQSGGPGRARLAIEGLRLLAPNQAVSEQPARLLPWIPLNVTPPQTPEVWRWGIRVAQRILQLQLDVLRAGLRALGRDENPRQIIHALPRIGLDLQALDRVHLDFIDPTGASAQAAERLLCLEAHERQRALDELTRLCEGIGVTVFGFLRSATTAFAEAYQTLSSSTLERAGLPSATELLQPDTETPQPPELGPVVAFLERALPIETIRRSFSDDYDIDSAQPLHVAQLTPLIQAPLFDRPRDPSAGGTSGGPEPGDNPGGPGGDPDGGSPDGSGPLGPRTAKDKLCGLRLGHFAGFYRSSWRENDFMWGRLDGAAAIARLLIDSQRARALDVIAVTDRDAEFKPWAQLATALMPTAPLQPGDDERLQLLVELLRSEASEENASRLTVENPDGVHNELVESLRRSLLDDGAFAWAVCARALQYEILREEAPHLIKQTQVDKEAGAQRTNLGWNLDHGLMQVINRIRTGAHDQRGRQGYVSLPQQLGCDDPDEATSTLALRTISQTMLVSLAALSGAFPLTRLLQPVRLPLLAIQGATARRTLDRLAVMFGFAGAAWYLASRWLSTPAAPGDHASAAVVSAAEHIPLKALWSPQVIVLWLAILTVIGVAVIPAVRAISARTKGRRVWEAAVAATFIICGGAVALVWQWGLRGTIEALTTWHATYSPPAALLWVVAGAAGVHASSSLDTVLRFAGPIIDRLGKWVSVQSLTFGAIGGTLAGYCATKQLIPTVNDGGMKSICALLALAGPIAVASYVSVGPALLKSIRWFLGFAGQATQHVRRVTHAVRRPWHWIASKLPSRR